MDLSRKVISEIVERALREDVGQGDITTLALIPASTTAEAHITIREPGVVAGMPVLTAVFAAVDPTIIVSSRVCDGDTVAAGTTLAYITGSARGILTAERVALNFIQRLSGIATMTSRYILALEGYPTRILDTRKTTPALRVLEKYAVRVGGGTNHRFGLYDAVMLKDNHLALLAALGVEIEEAVQRARSTIGPMVRIEVEVESVEQARRAAAAGADIILLDNMAPDEMRAAVIAVGDRAKLEASGGITLENLQEVAKTGVDYISVGALTHSVRALDISLDLDASTVDSMVIEERWVTV